MSSRLGFGLECLRVRSKKWAADKDTHTYARKRIRSGHVRIGSFMYSPFFFFLAFSPYLGSFVCSSSKERVVCYSLFFERRAKQQRQDDRKKRKKGDVASLYLSFFSFSCTIFFCPSSRPLMVPATSAWYQGPVRILWERQEPAQPGLGYGCGLLVPADRSGLARCRSGLQ